MLNAWFESIIYVMHEILKLDTLATRRAKSMVKLTYSVLHDKVPCYLYGKLSPINHVSMRTRAKDAGELIVPRVRSNYDTYGYSYRGPLQWNMTKVNLKAAVNKIQLKNLIKTSW